MMMKHDRCQMVNLDSLLGTRPKEVVTGGVVPTVSSNVRDQLT